MTPAPLTIGVDVGGTSVRAGVVDAAGRVLADVETTTPTTDTGLESAVERVVAELTASHEVVAVGLAVAGFLDRERTTVRFAPHLPWRSAPVRERTAARLGLPVVLEQDANAALWAEYRFGAAAGAGVAVLVTIGTGIGAALLSGGQLYRGAHGVAPELGHVCLVPGGRVCPCGGRGCWERYCSGTALVATVLELLASDPARPTVLAPDDGSPLTGRRVMRAARDGDPVAMGAAAELAVWLGRGLVMVRDVYDPDVIVVGGGVSDSGALFLGEAEDYCRVHTTGAEHRPPPVVRGARLGAAAGIVGAADLARGRSRGGPGQI